MNPSTEAKTLTDLHTINLGYSGFSSDQECWSYLRSVRAYLASKEACGQIGFTDSVTTTTIAQVGVPVKIAGTTSAGITNLFTATNGRLTLATASARLRVTLTASVSEGNNTEISTFIAKNGAVIQSSKCTHTVDTTSHHSPMMSQALVDLVEGDYLEGFVQNGSTTSSIGVLQFCLIAK